MNEASVFKDRRRLQSQRRYDRRRIIDNGQPLGDELTDRAIVLVGGAWSGVVVVFRRRWPAIVVIAVFRCRDRRPIERGLMLKATPAAVLRMMVEQRRRR